MRHLALGVAALTCLSACAEGLQEFNAEAGSATVGDRGFGSAYVNNIAANSGDLTYAHALGARFAAEVDTTITFAFDSAALSPEARATLARQAAWIRQFPEVRFRVYGHTDLVGSAAYNEALGLRRARAAVSYLVSLGIDRSRLEAVASFGETQPVIPTPEPERANRRTVTEVSGFVARHPTLLDGEYAAIIQREYVESATAPTGLVGISGDEVAVGE